ncbi:MAG: type II toxin-antitoxin system VapC family toxin [Pseudomonadota bacterium]
MLLVDTSVWVDHLRRNDPALVTALLDGRVVCHPHIIGELALGSLAHRVAILTLLRALPGVTVAQDDEVLTVIEQRQLFGRGIGFVDCHLLASLLLTPGTALWTRDKRLADVAAELQRHG